jgi:hypothetical protein
MIFTVAIMLVIEKVTGIDRFIGIMRAAPIGR